MAAECWNGPKVTKPQNYVVFFLNTVEKKICFCACPFFNIYSFLSFLQKAHTHLDREGKRKDLPGGWKTPHGPSAEAEVQGIPSSLLKAEVQFFCCSYWLKIMYSKSHAPLGTAGVTGTSKPKSKQGKELKAREGCEGTSGIFRVRRQYPQLNESKLLPAFWQSLLVYRLFVFLPPLLLLCLLY